MFAMHANITPWFSTHGFWPTGRRRMLESGWLRGRAKVFQKMGGGAPHAFECFSGSHQSTISGRSKTVSNIVQTMVSLCGIPSAAERVDGFRKVASPRCARSRDFEALFAWGRW